MLSRTAKYYRDNPEARKNTARQVRKHRRKEKVTKACGGNKFNRKNKSPKRATRWIVLTDVEDFSLSLRKRNARGGKKK